jgi:hypothetical protein
VQTQAKCAQKERRKRRSLLKNMLHAPFIIIFSSYARQMGKERKIISLNHRAQT